ncbi:hypothetical protein E4U55_002911 [Claviceps digitariae]|nr:hypothetical protein E4U55_002911 [Claviceps digitariae]
MAATQPVAGLMVDHEPATALPTTETTAVHYGDRRQDLDAEIAHQPQNAAVDAVLDCTDAATYSDISSLPVPRGTTTTTSSVSSAPSPGEPNSIPVPSRPLLGTCTPGQAGLSRSTTNTTIRSTSSGSVSSATTTTPSSNNRPSAYIHAPGPTQPQHHHPPPPSAIRKTSPGLAARLKALGFGAPKQPGSPVTPQVDHIGRLDEQQLRQLDEKHQANSISSIISRRGRPWKGAGAYTSAPVSADSSTARSIAGAESPQLPEIRAPEPLAMDTQKYRLPDHMNGNGTKATLETRREHIERVIRPSTPPEATPPEAIPPEATPPPPSPPGRIPPPPPPPPKDTPPRPTPSTPPPPATSSNDYVPGLNSYFTPGRNRPGSIYTLSRASFANQLAQLTSLQLPDAESLSSKVAAIRTAHIATQALINASDQIRNWIAKAQEVIGGLDSEDDVEWAAAGGREGLEEVENALNRFEHLINAYIGAIEELQQRSDITHVPSEDLKQAVTQMESIVDEWARIRAALTSVRMQVEIAMEWEELWNNVLGDIQGEMDELGRLIFEMEERRHKGVMASAGADVDIGDLETIVEDTPPPGARLQAQNRYSLPSMPVMSPGTPGNPGLSQEDSSLLALFARMQPLRASLDFLPMRLSVFEARAKKCFPTACEEVEMRRNGLDASYKKLEKDAESLRKELGEDRWVIVFRGAGRQAQKMHESVKRSLLKLSEAIETEVHLQMPPTMMKKIESYEAKKTHYGPAIERVLSIIDRGVKDRLTVNGEILRLHHDMQTRWEALKVQIHEMDAIIDDIEADRRSQQLRDSVSSMLSMDRSTIGSGRDTPGSSPPSSVIMASLGFDPHTPLSKGAGGRSLMNGGGGGGSSSSSSSISRGTGNNGNGNKVPHPANRRHSSLPAPAAYTGRRAGFRLSTIASTNAATPAYTAKIPTARPGSNLGHRPVWNGSMNSSSHLGVGHHQYKPLGLSTPSPSSKATPISQRTASALTPASATKLPVIRGPFSRASSDSPMIEDSPSRGGHSRLSFRDKAISPGPFSQPTQSKPRLTTKLSMSALSSKRRVSMQPSGSDIDRTENQAPRPASSLASTSRRTSFLPQLKGRLDSSFGARKPALEPKDLKPRWRH